MPKTIPVERMYEQRQQFVVVALTLIIGTERSAFAQAMLMPLESWVKEGLLRDIDTKYIRCSMARLKS